MITKKIKTLFKGRAGIHERYINQALKEKRDLLIEYNYDRMLIPFKEINNLGIKGEDLFLDRFNDNYYHLYYFNWEPSIIQEQLL